MPTEYFKMSQKSKQKREGSKLSVEQRAGRRGQDACCAVLCWGQSKGDSLSCV